MLGKHQIGTISYNEEQSIVAVEEGIVDLDHGSRFEGFALTEINKNKGNVICSTTTATNELIHSMHN